LKLIEWRFGLAPLTARDASSTINNLVASFNFNSPDTSLPALPEATTVFAPPCFEGGIFSADTNTISGTPRATRTQLGTRANEMTTLANSKLVQDFLKHPHVRSLALSQGK
jgi:phospholipase C